MTGCSGCGKPLGYKKYKFHKMWRIPGYYCKECMLYLGKDFDDHGKLTLPKYPCHLCSVEFFFLKSAWQGKKQHKYCDVCKKAVETGVIPSTNQTPKRLPQVMMIFAGLGVLMMVMGLLFTLFVGTNGEGSLVNIIFGSLTTALGFVLFRKTIRSRGLIMGKSKQIVDTEIGHE